MQTIDHVIEHGRDSFEIDHQQLQFIKEKAAFLVDFLECYRDNLEIEDLQTQIANVSHAADDLIESRVVDFIHDKSTNIFYRQLQKAIKVVGSCIVGMCSTERPFCQQLKEVIESMNLMKEEVMKIKEKREVEVELPKDPTVPASSSTSSTSLPAVGKDAMVGFDDVLNQIMDRLTRQQSGPRQTIPISGMGGLGKTTLARNVYETPYIVKHFDVRAWVTISQEYEIKDILSNLLIEFKISTERMDQKQLGEKLHKHLFGRRYLIVMDDMWSIDVWDKVQLFFPDNGNGSRIVITTRLSNMASQLGSCNLEMNLLGEGKSWELFRLKAFGQQDCPPGFEEIGREITKNCKGLPLSIVVIAGVLAKSNMKREYWNYVAAEVNSIISQSEDGQCSKILTLSYKNLPVHLKPCLLYMGVYPEDDEIKVSELVKLWVAEGFLRPNKTKTLEEVGEEYLTDLVDRNLIMVHRRSSRGKMKHCKIHDLLGDLCLREAQIENFICVPRKKCLPNQRRIVVDKSKKEQRDSVRFNNQEGALPAVSSLPRSVTFNSGTNLSLRGCKLIRVLSGAEEYKLHQIASNQFNLRYLKYYPSRRFPSLKIQYFPSSINLLWNLQTINVVGGIDETSKGPDIWKMRQLRHFSVNDYRWNGVYLPQPPPLVAAAIYGDQEDTILKHLQTLTVIHNMTFSEGVVKRIPNIKKLKVYYSWDLEKDYCLSNLQYLPKLESLYIIFGKEKNYWVNGMDLLGNSVFPDALKKLYLEDTYIPCKDISTIIGCLPNLQVLKLDYHALMGEEWNPIEGQFISLKYLEISYCTELKVWNADSIHFPVLEELVLSHMTNLEEIQQGMGDITTLKSIKLIVCSDSSVRSAMDILDEQENQGNFDIKLEVELFKNQTRLKRLETRDNFIVRYY